MIRLPALGFAITGVPLEGTGRCKFAQLVSHHILSNEYGDKLMSVMYSDRMTYEVGRDHRSTTPRLDDILLVLLIHLQDTLLELHADIRSFLK